MVNSKRKLLRILSAVYAVLLLLTLGLRVGGRALERREKINRFTYAEQIVEDYKNGVPVEEIDFDKIALWYFRLYTEPVSNQEESSVPNLVETGRDLRYYQKENGRKKLVYKIPKGTVLYWNLRPESTVSPVGYGRISYPTYEKGWRWVRPFLTEEWEIPENFKREITMEREQELEKAPYYYVRLEDLLAVEQAAYSQHEEVRRWFPPNVNMGETVEDLHHEVLTHTDEMLYRGGTFGVYGKGVYCSPDIGPLVWRSEDTVYAVLLAVTAFLAIVVFRRKPERENEAGEQG